MKYRLLILSFLLAIASCRDKDQPSPADTITTQDFIYNSATRQFTPDTAVSGTVSSPAGVQLIYFYLVRNNRTDSLIYAGTPATESRHDYSFSIPNGAFINTDMREATGIKVMVRHTDNSSYEGNIKLTAFTPPLPVMSNFPATLEPDLSGGITVVTGNIKAESGLQRVDLYDDYQGEFELLHSITDLNNAKDYTLSYDYTYREKATHLKVTATDSYGQVVETIIEMPVLSYNVWKDITMTAQGSSSIASVNSFFSGATGTLFGNCDISGHEKEIDFLTYCSAAFVMTFYSPTNTSGVAKNYKCNGAAWEPDPADMRATRFRVIVPGTADADDLYAKYNSNDIESLEDALFGAIAVPSSSTAKYDANEANQSANTFNLTTASLVWVRVPQADGSFKNGLIKVKAVNVAGTAGLSTLTFDILMQQ